MKRKPSLPRQFQPIQPKLLDHADFLDQNAEPLFSLDLISRTMTEQKQIVVSLRKPNEKFWYPSKSSDFVFRQTASGGLAKPIEDEVEIHSELYESRDENVVARAMLTEAAKGKFETASLRFINDSKGPPHNQIPPIKFDQTIELSAASKKFLFSQDASGDFLLHSLGIIGGSRNSGLSKELTFSNFEIGEKYDKPDFHIKKKSGLIVFAGGTGTGKSFYAKGLALRLMVRLAITRWRQHWDELKDELVKNSEISFEDKKSLRNEIFAKYDPPHLVTFEDPIEKWTVKLDGETHFLNDHPTADINIGLRLTSRAKDHDVSDLKSACLHSLRQKPSLVFIGECREEADWKLALELGNTGHLVVTTCHASSLVDTFVKLNGTDGADAQSRQRLASSLAGVIHLRQADFSKFGAKGSKLDPTQTLLHVWRRTDESIGNFVVDGLSSLVNDDQNVLSRTHVAQKLLDWQWSKKFVDWPDSKRSLTSWTKEALRCAFELDLRGE